MTQRCRLPVRIGFSLLGGLLGALNPAWLLLLSSPDRLSYLRGNDGFDRLAKLIQIADLYVYLFFVQTFLTSFFLVPWFYRSIAEMRVQRKVGFLQLWGSGLRFGLAASVITAGIIYFEAVVYNYFLYPSSDPLQSLLLLPIAAPFLGFIGIFLSFPAFFVSAFVFAWLVFRYQVADSGV